MANYLQNIIKELLTEEATIPSVSDAIRKRKEVEIFYYDTNDKGSGKRIIQPVAYGLSKAGNMVLRAYQPYGDTQTKIPSWKMFRFDRIRHWKTLHNRIFNEPPTNAGDGKYNPNGDETMAKVYLNANFERSRDYYAGKRAQGLKKYNDERRNNKLQQEPLYNLKKNIEKSISSDEVKKRIEQYPSDAAKAYVNNKEYQNDMKKVNTQNIENNQTTEPIQQNSMTYIDNNNRENNRDYNEIDKMGPVLK